MPANVSTSHMVKLTDRESLAEGTMAFHFEKPQEFQFTPGQYVDVTLVDPPETDSEGNIRSFSIASAPFEGHITLATRMRDTAFKRVLKSAPLGLEAKVDGPMGSFTLHKDPSKAAVFLAGGIGITPFFSILRHAAHEKLPHRLYLFYSNAAFFERLARFGESWRLFSEFAEDCVYVDIETTGLSTAYDDITVVGTSDGKNFKAFVRGENLRDLASELKKYSVAVTFNGSGFDLPFLRKSFAKSIPQVHIDLRWVAYKLGYRGGLKEIEHNLGIKRPKRIADMDGFEAIILWQQYRRGDKHALERLIEYNRSDVMNLRGMMRHCYDKLLDHHSKLFRRKRM